MHHSTDLNKVCVAVLTLSDTRNKEEDTSGQYIQATLSTQHIVSSYQLIPDDADQLTSVLNEWSENPKIHAIICNGGTGMSKRDITYATISALIEKEMFGFGEAFRHKSFQAVGARGMLSNAIAGVYKDTAIFALPGSVNAVTLALDELIMPILTHFVGELHK